MCAWRRWGGADLAGDEGGGRSVRTGGDSRPVLWESAEICQIIALSKTGYSNVGLSQAMGSAAVCVGVDGVRKEGVLPGGWSLGLQVVTSSVRSSQRQASLRPHPAHPKACFPPAPGQHRWKLVDENRLQPKHGAVRLRRRGWTQSKQRVIEERGVVSERIQVELVLGDRNR